MKIKKNASKKTYIEVIAECIKVLRLPIIIESISIIFYGNVNIYISNVIGTFADDIFMGKKAIDLYKLISMLLCVFVTVIIIPAIQYTSDYYMFKKSLQHDKVIYHLLLSKEQGNIQADSYESLIYILESAPDDLRRYTVIIVSRIIATPICLGYLVYSTVRISWILLFLLALTLIIKTSLPFLLKKEISRCDDEKNKYNDKRRVYEDDIINYCGINKHWGINTTMIDRLNSIFNKYYKSNASRIALCEAIYPNINEYLDNILIILVIIISTILMSMGQISFGSFAVMMAVYNTIKILTGNIVNIFENSPLLKNAAEKLRFLYNTIDISPNIKVNEFNTISFENVSFKYTDEYLFENLNFSIKNGDKLAILGANGKGKSTLLKMLCLLLHKYEGIIKIDETDIKCLNIDDWRMSISVVTQDAYVFNTTVRENLRAVSDQIDECIIDTYLKIFNIFNIAECEVKHNMISGGEKQKISIIRSLLKESKILILDEPTNHLDKNSVNFLKNYIRTSEKTIILVTHDTSLLEVVDYNINI